MDCIPFFSSYTSLRYIHIAIFTVQCSLILNTDDTDVLAAHILAAGLNVQSPDSKRSLMETASCWSRLFSFVLK